MKKIRRIEIKRSFLDNWIGKRKTHYYATKKKFFRFLRCENEETLALTAFGVVSVGAFLIYELIKSFVISLLF